ncbi:MAG: 3'-5' exonuclease [Opitutaceae bacterium]|jgi:DNA polymerase-3 subunit epsilon|nr:3'-5' exonuclease [Opitutaceae bacterium]
MPAHSWTLQPIHFVDFEGNLSSGILEFGAATVLGGEVVASATALCRPTGRVRTEDTAVHGLDAGALSDKRPFADEFERFSRLRETGPLASHFSGAENSLIKSVWPYPRQSPDFGAGGTDWGPWVDTGRLYPQFYRGLRSARLEDLVADFNLLEKLDALAAKVCPEGRRRFHAALYDALAGALLLARLAEEPSLRDKSPAWLLAMSTLDGARRGELSQPELF